MKKILFMGLLICVSLFMFSSISFAVETEGKKVESIEVKGNKVVSASTILAKIRTKTGQPFSQNVISEDIKRLYGLGFFRDIKTDVREGKEGLRVTFHVTEKPFLEKVVFEGAKALKPEKLQKVVQSKAGEVLDLKKVKKDAAAIKELYEETGLPLVKVEDKVEGNADTNKAVLYFIVREGTRFRIKEIIILGNKMLSDKKILKAMDTRRDTLFTSGLFKKDVFDQDMEKIKNLYQRAGFLDAVVEPDFSYDEKKGKMYITINITEGRRFKVGEITIKGAVVFPEAGIRNVLTMDKGAVFSRENLRQDVGLIQQYYFERGYIFAEIRADTFLNQMSGEIDITYDIVENEMAYVDKIKIKGNTKTKDIVIRRELRIYPGEAFDGVKLQRSKERLYNLGFFEEVAYDIEPGSAPTKKDLVVNVKETKTGELSFGAGYSSIDQFVGFTEISQNNFDIANFPTFTGDGQKLRLKVEFGTVREDYELSFTEPWIFDRPLLFGFDLYQKTRKRESTVGRGFDEQRQGGDIRLGKEFSEYVRGDLLYRLENVDISDVSTEASQDLKKEEGKNTISSLTVGATRDTRDSVFNPTKGVVLSGSLETAGGPFGGDKDYLKYIGSWSYYITPIEKNLLELTLRAGLVDRFGDSEYVPIYARFYAGGSNTIRGYRERRIGPRDPSSNDPIGGESMVVATLEYTFPIIESLKGALFCDMGNVWEKSGDIGSGDFKTGVGMGVRVKTPIGPIRLDYGYPLKEAHPGEEKAGRFHFSLSRAF